MQTRLIVDWTTHEITVGAGYLSGRLRVKLTLPGNVVLKGELPMALVITDTQAFTVDVTALSSKDNVTRVDGPIVFTTSDPSILGVTVVDEDTARFFAVGPVGTAQGQAKADADLGAGIVEIVGLLDVEIVAGPAVKLVLTPSAPQEQ